MNAKTVRYYRDLEVWRTSMALARGVYTATVRFPKQEIFGLTNQIRRASVSIPSNIAEGFGRGSRNEFKRYLLIAKGSLCELETQLILSHELGYLPVQTFTRLSQHCDLTGKLLNGLLRSLKSDNASAE